MKGYMRVRVPMADDDLMLWAQCDPSHEGTLKDVAITELLSTQFTVKRKVVRRYLSGREIDPIHVVTVHGRLLILDGHHRVTAFQLDGQTHIRALVSQSRIDARVCR